MLTEIEWLKQESGLSDDDIKGLEAVGGWTKVRTGLMKVLRTLSEQALKDARRKPKMPVSRSKSAIRKNLFPKCVR